MTNTNLKLIETYYDEAQLNEDTGVSQIVRGIHTTITNI